MDYRLSRYLKLLAPSRFFPLSSGEARLDTITKTLWLVVGARGHWSGTNGAWPAGTFKFRSALLAGTRFRCGSRHTSTSSSSHLVSRPQYPQVYSANRHIHKDIRMLPLSVDHWTTNIPSRTDSLSAATGARTCERAQSTRLLTTGITCGS